MPDSWQPLNEAHAIDVAAALVNFSEPVNEILWKRTLRIAEELCPPAGLSNRAAVNTIQFTLNAGQFTPRDGRRPFGSGQIPTTEPFGSIRWKCFTDRRRRIWCRSDVAELSHNVLHAVACLSGANPQGGYSNGALITCT